MDVNRWNGNHFPYKLEILSLNGQTSLILSKYLLDNLEGDINLEDAPCMELLKIDGKDKKECYDVFKKTVLIDEGNYNR